MDFIWNSITDWLKEVLVSGIVSNLSGMFDSTNEQIGEIAGQVGLTPQAWNSGIFNMIQNLSNNVILPLAGAILAIVMTLELIQLITDRNNLNDVDTWMFFKWVFKSAAAVLIVSNTWTIVMGIFDAAQSVVNGAAGVMIGNTSIDISSVVTDLESRLMEMDVGPLLGLWFQSLFVGICTWASAPSPIWIRARLRSRKRPSVPDMTWISFPPTLPPTVRKPKSCCPICKAGTRECFWLLF